jgi:hypothetical protein
MLVRLAMITRFLPNVTSRRDRAFFAIFGGCAHS